MASISYQQPAISNQSIIILHGENVLASRKVLLNKITAKKKEGFTEEIRLDGKLVKMTDLIQAVESHTLFGQKRLVVIENLFLNKSTKFKGEVFEYFLKNKDAAEMILWESKPVSKATQAKWSKAARFIEFKIPANIFRFLDSLRPGNTKMMLSLLHENINKESAEMVFYMLVRQFRLLLLAKDSPDNLSKMPTWMRQKFTRQAEVFEHERLEKIYKKLLKIDIGQKTGTAVVPLESELDFLVISF